MQQPEVCKGGAWVVTKYSDGTEVHAHPNHDPDSVALAVELRYDNVEQMTLFHDDAHTELAWLLGYSPSPTLWAQAHDQSCDTDLIRAEEALVLAYQKFMNIWEANSGTR